MNTLINDRDNTIEEIIVEFAEEHAFINTDDARAFIIETAKYLGASVKRAFNLSYSLLDKCY